ncbi:hypothetical protein RF11_01056 [Thelohanellus kitauei]|uniref:Uncharacterized protein n=1 Tax=Thelohanellus kitauei TaxID=669202 RepID=A0A0C2ME90_THEKT|nr:hypothetical protein RF11_01056 [Thelohanellus kitauei]
MPFYNSFCYQPYYLTYYGFWPYYGTPYISNMPNFQDYSCMQIRPEELISPPLKKKEPNKVELEGWKPINICCGTIFEGPQGQFLVDPKYICLHTGKCMYRALYGHIYQNNMKRVTFDDETELSSSKPKYSKISQTQSDCCSEIQSSEIDSSLCNGSLLNRSSMSSSRNLRPRKNNIINWDQFSSDDD